MTHPASLGRIVALLGCALACWPLDGRAAPPQREVAAAEVTVSKKAPRATASDRALTPAQRWGITPVSIRTASGGFMLYFRYRVVDAGRARPLFEKGIKPRVVERATGAALTMPEDTKLGALRSSPRAEPENGKEYFVLFSNAAQLITKGSHVDVSLGDCKLADLVVE